LTLFMMILLVATMPTGLADTFKLYVGDMQTLTVGKVKRVAIGNGKLMSSSILENGDLLILAEKEGDTELKIWLENGKVFTHKFFITKTDSARTSSEAAAVLKNIPGLSTRRVGSNIILEGFTSEVTAKLIDKVTAKYSDIINLTVQTSLADIADLLNQIPGISVKKVGKFAVISGAVDAKGKAAIEAVKAGFPEILDLTTEDKVSKEPMVYMNVQITEFSTNALENLGINWSTSFAGPSVGYTNDFTTIGDRSALASAFTNQTATNALTASGLTTGRSATGYFGIATLITSTINLAVSSGDALILASPTLSAKSGGSAEFLSGGQVPVPVPGPDGTTTIEYKDYGISLKIEPKAGITGNIVAKVETEVSSIDTSVSFGNTPGFKNRSAKTEANLKDGETLVISGLVNRDLGSDVSRVKWLSDIPILGELFKSTNFKNNRSDLVIFITPHIVDPNSEINKVALEKANQLREQFIKNAEVQAEILD
jgi:pilus assembly protein CpaC